MKTKIVVLTLLFLFLTAAMTPVGFVIDKVELPRDVAVLGLEGSVWSGSAAEIIAGKIALKNMEYTVSPFALFLAKLSANIKLKGGNIKGSFNVLGGTDIAKNVSFENVSIRLPASQIENFVSIFGAKLAGNISTSNINAQLGNRKIISLEGQGRWRNASVNFAGQLFNLGEFSAEFTTNEQSKVIQGELKKTNNALGLEGKLTLTPNGVLEFIGSVSTDIDQNLFFAASIYKNGSAVNGRLPIKFKQKVL